MSNSQSWPRKKLTKMLYHSFIGTLADNSIEIGWILCFSLLADKGMVERITTMFGLNDAFWVILSSTYYTARTSLMARLPKLLKEHGEGEASKQVKNHVYLFYIMLLPMALGSLLFLPKLLTILGVTQADSPLYIPYFQWSIIAILVAAPWSILIPSYLRIRGDSRTATILDHLIAWFMILGIFVTTHVFHLGVLWALIVNIFANAIPLFWFLYKQPIENFWSKGFEFSLPDIKESWKIIKWELVRRLSPRIAAIVGASFMITINPVYLAVKYWISNLATFLEGWVDAMAGLLNSHVSRNTGLKNTIEPDIIPYKDNEYLFQKSLVGVFLSVIIIYFGATSLLTFLPETVYQGITNPFIYMFLTIEVGAKLRYYMWLSVSRSYRQDLNGTAQLFYAIPTALLTPTCLWIFLHRFQFGLLGIFATGAIVGTIQWIPTECYFRKKLNEAKD